ncbi:MAG TPA: GerMN domain-containing protein [Pyrinomonadaceae bacterium]
MRKSLRAAMAACALLVALAGAAGTAAAQAGRQDAPVAGGYREVPAVGRDVLRAARFAVREQGRRGRRPLSLLAVRRAEQQVVAGLNYRLELSVRSGGETRAATAVVYQNLRNTLSLTEWNWAAGDAATQEVRLYLVALDDRGRRGRKIGCDDSLVPVTRRAAAGGDRLKAAVEALIAEPREGGGGLNNYWHSEDLRVASATVRGGTATVRVRGTLPVAGVCDEPRIEEQIKATARQFRGVRSARVFLNGQRLSDAIR